MQTSLKTCRRGYSGFTLIEVMVVITILGILAAVVVINYGSFQAQARDSTRVNDLQQIQLALETYRAYNGHYPFESDGYSGDDSAGIICTDANRCSAARLNTPINRFLAAEMGPNISDPMHNEGSGTNYWYYYDGRKNCSTEFHVVSLHAREMETEGYRNIEELSERCPRFLDQANEGGGIGSGGTAGPAHLIIVDFLDVSGTGGVNW